MNFPFSSLVYADTIDISPRGTDFSSIESLTVPNIIGTGITWILVLAAIVAFIFLVYGGIKWITSGGDKESTAKAQGTITAALIGLAIVFSAWAILRLLEMFFGINIFGGGGTLNLPNAVNGSTDGVVGM